MVVNPDVDGCQPQNVLPKNFQKIFQANIKEKKMRCF